MTFAAKKTIAVSLCLLLLLPILSLCGCSKSADTVYRTPDDLRGKTIAVITGSVTESMLQNYYGDSVEISYYNSNADMAAALEAGKADAYLACIIDAELQCEVHTDQHCLPDPIDSLPVAFFFPQDEDGDALCAQMNEFIASEDVAAIYQAWIDDPDAQCIPDTPLTAENGTLIYACCTNIGQPQCYIRDNAIVGSEIETAYRFCMKYGYGLKIEDYDLSGMLGAVAAGKADFGGSGTLITEERKKSVSFSEATHYNKFVLTVQGGVPLYSDPDELIGTTIGCISGASTGTLLEEYYGDTVQLDYYNANADMAAALEADKISAYCTDNVVAARQCELYDDQTMMEVPLQVNDVAFFFQKDNAEADALREQVNEFILGLKEDGTLEELSELWYNGSEAERSIDTDLTGENGTLTLACSSSIGYPFCYMGSDGYMGLDIDLAYRFCKANGYALECMDCDFGGMLGSVTAGKADFGGTHLAVTPERQESVNFSEPYDTLSFNLVVKTTGTAGGSSFFARLASSFEKTFITENRWKLFLSGLGTTLLITVLSIVFGTLLGYAVYMACRSGSTVINKLTDAFMWLINGMPTVVLLMLLFYIIFGSSSLSGTWVAVIAYTLVFAVGFTAMLRQSVDSIDPGQLEAAYALGYTKTHAFTRRILPQAIRRLLPAYKAQTVTIIKSTAIVGYIAVQDLTKAGDIIRSRTFEAFFPILSTAALYFLLAAILSFLVKNIELNFDPKRRSHEKILKGVKR